MRWFLPLLLVAQMLQGQSSRQKHTPLPWAGPGGVEQPQFLSLDDVLRLSRERSREALTARHRFRSSYWSFKTYRATYLPKLNLSAELPSLQRAISKYTTADGSEIFLERSFVSSSADLSLSKQIGPTGGTFFLSTGLERIDNLSDSVQTSWLSNPLTIGYSQPLFNYNQWRFANKIEPMRYEEARRKYIEEMEQLALTATQRFFSLLLSELRLEIAQVNEANYDTLYKIAVGRYNLGKIAENELLQLELSYLQAQAEVENARLELEMNRFRLRSFLRLPDDVQLSLVPPEAPPAKVIDVTTATAYARQNRSDAIAMERGLLESEEAVYQAKAESKLNANLYALYGLTQSADRIENVYGNPQDQQQLTLGIQLPLVDWGLAKGKIKLAESNLELTRTGVEQQQIDFDQEVFLKVMQYNMQKQQFEIAGKADTVAQKRYNVTKQRYLVGKITITDLNIAQVESDNARRAFIAALQSYWQNYFDLRRLTLFDFSANKPLGVDFESLLAD